MTPQGEQRVIQVIKAPVFDAHGKVVGTQGTLWDVTEHKRLQEALEQTTAELARVRQQLQDMRR